jgi:hypothetical protein
LHRFALWDTTLIAQDGSSALLIVSLDNNYLKMPDEKIM